MSSENQRIRTKEDTADDLQSKSNTQLLEEIDRILAQGTEMDSERLERYLDTLQERAPVMEDYDPQKAWEQLQAGHPLLFEETAPDDKPLRPDRDAAPRKFRGHKLLRTLEVAALLALILILTANAAGVNPVKAVLEWADELIQVYQNPSGSMELPPDDPSQFHTLEEALKADGLDTKALPTWVPKDYSLRVLDIRRTEESTKYSAIYRSDRGELMIRVSNYYDFLWSTAEERENGGTVYTQDGVDFYLVTNHEQCKAGWQIGQCFYAIRGQISEDELKEMINSIKLE